MPRCGAASRRVASSALSFLLLGFANGAVQTEPGVIPDDALPCCQEAFSLVSALSLKLIFEDVPSDMSEGSLEATCMLEAAAAALQKRLPTIRRSAGVFEIFWYWSHFPMRISAV